jgi:hypothetical protein
MVVGTPQYLSPEQALGRGVDARSDLYSVGIMLFQLVTGRLPFDADSPLAIAYAHVQEEPPVPSSINRSLPPAVDALIARALRKNPNERFPSAESMRDECLRVAAAVSQPAPNIVAGTQAQSGAGVGAAVFPPVDSPAPNGPTGPVQTPYRPTPPSAPQPNPYGGPAPVPGPHSPAYGYPQQGGYGTPSPQAGYGPQQGASTPPPYTLQPQGPASGSGGSGDSGGKGNRGVIIGSTVVAVVAVLGLVIALIVLNDDGNDARAGRARASASEKASGQSGHKGPDTTKTIEKTKCTEPDTSYDDADQIMVPSFQFKNLTSVKDCLQAAGWKYDVVRTDENTYGEDTVMDQYPAADTDVDPKDMPTIKLTVSTGDPA